MLSMTRSTLQTSSILARLSACASLFTLLGLASTASAQVLIGATTVSGGLTNIVEVNPVTGETRAFMTVPVPAGFELWTRAAWPPCRIAGTVYRGDTANNRSRLIKIDPATRTSQILEFAPPLNTSYSEGMDWSPRHNAFIISFGPLGNFGPNRLALFDENGAVSMTSGPLPTSDMDTIVSSSTLDLIFDLNRSSGVRVFALSALFPAPAVASYATPPVQAAWFDGTIHPTTGEVLFSITGGTRLQTLVGNTYVPGVQIQGGVGLRGLTWARLAPIILTQPANASVCAAGTADIGVTGIFDQPATFRWQRETAPGGGTFVDLADGSASSWDGNIAGSGAIISGVTTSTLRVGAGAGLSLSAAHAIRYRCVIANGCASVTTSEATLTIIQPCGLADIVSDSLDTDPCANGSIGPEDLDAFIAAFISGNLLADVASDSLDTTYNPNGAVGSEDLDAFIAGFIAGC